MDKKDLSNFQRNVVSRYYDNLDTIKLQRLGELVTDLYLADSPAKQQRLWAQAEKAMTQLKIKPAIIRHIMAKQSPEILAANLQDWLKAATKK